MRPAWSRRTRSGPAGATCRSGRSGSTRARPSSSIGRERRRRRSSRSPAAASTWRSTAVHPPAHRPAVGLRGDALERLHPGRDDDPDLGRPLPGQRAVVAVAQAPSTGRPGVATEPILVRPDDVEIEIRGAGNATRQVNNIMMPGFPADRLLVCEVFTPAGNWSAGLPTSTTWTTRPERPCSRRPISIRCEDGRVGHPAHLSPGRLAGCPPAGPARRPRHRRPGLPPVRFHAGL